MANTIVTRKTIGMKDIRATEPDIAEINVRHSLGGIWHKNENRQNGKKSAEHLLKLELCHETPVSAATLLPLIEQLPLFCPTTALTLINFG